jgi:hypothetical protein
LRRAGPDHLVHLQGRGHALEGLAPQVFHYKIALYQVERRRANHDGIRGRQSLEAGRNVGRIAQGEPFLPAAAPHLPHDDEAGVDAYPEGQAETVRGRQTRIQGPHRLQEA